MTKDILHTDSLDDVLVPSPIIPVPAAEDRELPVYRGLDGLYSLEAKAAWLMRVIMFVAMLALGLVMAAQVFYEICHFVSVPRYRRTGTDDGLVDLLHRNGVLLARA